MNYIFDMDGTLTESRSQMTTEMQLAFHLLAQKGLVVVISGATSEQMDKQVPFHPLWLDSEVKLYKLSQNGNICERNGAEIWRNKLDVYSRMGAFSHIYSLMKLFPTGVADAEDLVQDRGCQVSYSLIGHNADKTEKKNFDPTGAIRAELLEKAPFVCPHMTVKIGGTTCLDYISETGTKAHNLVKLLGAEELQNSIYIGDQLYDGGNDCDVKNIKGLKTHQVSGPEETLSLIRELLKV